MLGMELEYVLSNYPLSSLSFLWLFFCQSYTFQYLVYCEVYGFHLHQFSRNTAEHLNFSNADCTVCTICSMMILFDLPSFFNIGDVPVLRYYKYNFGTQRVDIFMDEAISVFFIPSSFCSDYS